MTASPMMLPIAEGSGSECEGVERLTLGIPAAADEEKKEGET